MVGYRNRSGTSSERPEAVIRIPEELSVLDILLFGPPFQEPYKRWRKPLKSIMNVDKFNEDNFQTDNEIDEWIANS